MGKINSHVCLAGILIVIAYNMSEWRTFRSILKGSYFDIVILLATFFLTVLVDLTVAIEVGVVLSSLLFMKRMGDIGGHIPADFDTDLIDDYSKVSKGVSIYEISGPLFFASAKQYASVLKELGIRSKVLVIRMRHVPFVDSTGLRNFKDVISILQKSGVTIILYGVKTSVLEEIRRCSIDELINESNIFDTFELALKHAEEIKQ